MVLFHLDYWLFYIFMFFAVLAAIQFYLMLARIAHKVMMIESLLVKYMIALREKEKQIY